MKINYRETQKGLAAVFLCPKCGTQLSTLVKSAGKIRTCKCGQKFKAPGHSKKESKELAENPYASPTHDSSVQEVEWQQLGFPGISTTANGLSLVFYGTLGLLIGMAVLFASFLGGSRSILAAVGGVGVVVSSMMLFVGPCLCLALPKEVGARGLIVGTIMGQAIGSSFAIIRQFGADAAPFYYGELFFGFLSNLLFVFFLQRLAELMSRDELVNEAGNIIYISLFCASTLTCFFLIGLIPSEARIANTIVGFFLFAGYTCRSENREKVDLKVAALVVMVFAIGYAIRAYGSLVIDVLEFLNFAVFTLFFVAGATFLSVSSLRQTGFPWVPIALPYFLITLAGYVPTLIEANLDRVLVLIGLPLFVVLIWKVELIRSLIRELKNKGAPETIHD